MFGTYYYKDVYQHHVVAPYWVDNDVRLNGRVSWEMYSTGDSLEANKVIGRVSRFIRMNSNSTNFEGNFVLVANWSEMHQYPAGESLANAQPYLNMVSKHYYCVYSYPITFSQLSKEQFLSSSAGNKWRR